VDQTIARSRARESAESADSHRRLLRINYGNHSRSRPHRSRWLARQIRPRSVARGPHPEQITRRLQPRRGTRRRKRPGGRGFHRRLPRHEIFWRGRQGLCPVALRVRRGGGGSHLQIGPSHDCRRSGDVALGARAARRCATSRRTRRHPRHGRSDAGGKPAINRWYYRQRMEATLTRAQRPWFILIDPGSQTACECGAGTAKVER